MRFPNFKNAVFLFHSVNDPVWFEKTIDSIQNYYNIVTLEEFYENIRNGFRNRGICCITFDDGDKSFYYNTFPVLNKNKIPATIFVSPTKIAEQKNFWFQEIAELDHKILKNYLSRKLNIPNVKLNNVSIYSIFKQLKIKTIENLISEFKKLTNINSSPCKLINIKQLLEIASSKNISLGAHTLNHPILKNETEKTVYNEIVMSITMLKDITGKEINYFSYPNGMANFDYGEREMNILKNEKIKAAFSTNIGLVKNDISIYEIPRIGLKHSTSFQILLKIILKKYWEVIKPGNNEKDERSYLRKIMNNTIS